MNANIALRAILLGGGLAGFADFVYPTLMSVINGGSALRPWLGVASGLLGASAREGGIGMAALGVVLHFFICISAAALLWVIVKHLRFLPRQWVVLGILHGIAVLLVMNYVILPLSAIGRSIYPLEDLHVHAFWHIVLVGLPTAFFVSRGLRAET
jgi:hypothetical protein